MDYYILRLIGLKVRKKIKLDKSETAIKRAYSKKPKGVVFVSHMCINEFETYKIEQSTIDDSYKHIRNREVRLLSDKWYKVGKYKNRFAINSHGDLVNWNIDYKTGYEFPSTRTDRIDFNSLPNGVDIKNPWELSRLQHLPRLAIIAYKDNGKRRSAIKEYKKEIIDFTKQNPIGFGVNYVCPMDIGIRIVNILTAHDILLQIDDTHILDQIFCKYLYDYIYNAVKYMLDNLEIDIRRGNNGNHYLANLCGIIFAGCYLKNNDSKRWIRFASKELFSEARKQFLDDGSNFECSTAYFRLSIEMLMAAIIMLRENGIEIPKDIMFMLSKSFAFTKLIVKDNEDIIQIGDNDSGRLVVLTETYYENTLTGRVLFDEFNALFGLRSNNINVSAEYYWIKSLIKDNTFEFHHYDYNGAIKQEKEDLSQLSGLKYEQKTVIKVIKQQDKILSEIRTNEDKVDGLSALQYADDFGLLKVSCARYTVYIRTPGRQTRGLFPHIHDDASHFEIVVGDKTYFGDQGSYLYTPDKGMRDCFRSSTMHNVPVFEKKNVSFNGCFNAVKNYKGCAYFTDENSILVQVECGTRKHIRRFVLDTDQIEVYDYANEPFEYHCMEPQYHSNGYGIIKTAVVPADYKDIIVEEFRE